MSAGDEVVFFKAPCPHCGGMVERWYFAPDCRGNPPLSGIDCTQCNVSFTAEEWQKHEDSVKK